MHLYRICVCLMFWLISGMAALGAAKAADSSAVVFSYNKFGETDSAITNVTMAQFDAHLAELTSGRYTVLPLTEIIDALQSGRELPDPAIAITIDDAYRSFYDRAWPKLRDARLPFTLFVWTDALDQKLRGYMSWDEVRELAKAGVTIGNHGAAHLDMALQTDAANRADLEKAQARFDKELGAKPTLLAYPYGGYGKRERDLAASLGFKAAFGHHSGVVYNGADMLALPRFALNEKHGGMARFKTAANAWPLRVTDLTPVDPVLTAENNPPNLGFTVSKKTGGLGSLSCFAGHQDAPLKIERLGSGRVEVRMDKALPVGNSRVNCTMPSGSGRWRWFGAPFTVTN